MAIWDDLLTEHDRQVYQKAGFGKKLSAGAKPVLPAAQQKTPGPAKLTKVETTTYIRTVLAMDDTAYLAARNDPNLEVMWLDWSDVKRGLALGNLGKLGNLSSKKNDR